jgi:hypothetical protein
MAASHELVLAVLPAVDELRSTTARVALQLLQELPAALGRSLERELEDIVPVLLKKAGELSTAGALNNSFCRRSLCTKSCRVMWGGGCCTMSPTFASYQGLHPIFKQS